MADELAAVFVVSDEAVEARNPLVQPDDVLVVARPRSQKVLTGLRMSSGKLPMRPCLAAAASWCAK